MWITVLFVVTNLFDLEQVAVIAVAPPPAEVRSADTPDGPEGDVRRVCRYERATGSNMQQRVCRNIPRAGVQDAQTREFMRATQQVSVPAGGIGTSPRPSGGPLE